MTERDIQFAIWNWRRFIQPYPIILCNIYFWGWESDALYITTAGYLWEYEIKTSHRDFLADAAKERKHLMMSNGGGPARFYYACPEGLIQPEEVPSHAGLVWAIERPKYLHQSIVVKREAPRRRVEPIKEKRWKELASKSNDRYWSVREKLVTMERDSLPPMTPDTTIGGKK